MSSRFPLPGIAPRMDAMLEHARCDLSGIVHIGIDEAGRGCLAGPVVAAAVLFPENFDFLLHLPGLADSKKVTQRRRILLADAIGALASAYGIGVSWQDEIDTVNILNATLRAMSRAVLALTAKLEETQSLPVSLPLLCIDGNQTIPLAHWQASTGGVPVEALVWEQYLPLPVSRLPMHTPALPKQRAIVDGDALVPSIAAASILAKTMRDELMIRLDAFYPDYGLARHKGYGTKEHRELLTSNGPCALHRKSFKPVGLFVNSIHTKLF